MNAPVAAPLAFISSFVNDVRDTLTPLLQECKKRVKKRLEYYTVPGHHDGRPIHPGYIMSLAKELDIDLNNLQGLEAQKIDDLREKLENQKSALVNWSARLRNMVRKEFPLIVDKNEGRDDLEEKLLKMDKENEELKNIMIGFSFSLFTAEYFKSQVQKHFPHSENFFKRQSDEKTKTKYMPPPIQGYDMQEKSSKTYDEFERFAKPFNICHDLIKEIQAKKGLEEKINIMNQKREEMLQELETQKENVRNLTFDKEELLKEMEKKKESERLLAIRSLVLTNMANILSLFVLRISPAF